MGGEIWLRSQISSGHGGEVLQEFAVVCTIRPFFLPSCFTFCHRGNKKPFVRQPRPPSVLLRLFGVAFGALIYCTGNPVNGGRSRRFVPVLQTACHHMESM